MPWKACKASHNFLRLQARCINDNISCEVADLPSLAVRHSQLLLRTYLENTHIDVLHSVVN